MRFLLSLLICLIFLSCNNDHLKKSNNTSSTNRLNKPFEKKSFNLDSLESSQRLNDSLRNLPKLNPGFLRSIIPKLNDSSIAENMLKNSHYTFFRRYGQININGNKGLLVVRVTDYDGMCGKIYLLVMNKSEKVIAETDLAEYYNPGAGSSSYLSSIQIAPNEFLQVVSGADVIESNKPDSLGIYESIGSEEYKISQKMSFQNGRFITTLIDSSSHIVKR
jgi:hypothetical protein